MTMKMACCNIQWSLKLFVQEENKPDNKIRLSVFNEGLNKLISLRTSSLGGGGREGERGESTKMGLTGLHDFHHLY